MVRDPWSRGADGGGKSDDVGGSGRVVAEEIRVTETAVPLATLGVEDPELRPSPRRPVTAAGDERLGPLADDVPPEPDPAATLELEPESRGFRDGCRQAWREARRLEGDEERLRPASEAGQATQPLADLRRGRPCDGTRRKVDHEDVDRAAGKEHPGDRQALVEGLRGQDDEPLQTDTAGGGLDRIEGSGEVQPGDDRAVGLGLGDEAEGEGRGAGAGSAPERHAGTPRETARTEDRVEGRKAGPDDPPDARSRLARGNRDRSELGWVVGWLGRERRRGQRSDHPRSCGTPPRLERRESSRHVRGEAGHRTVRLEQMFDIVNGIPCPNARPEPNSLHMGSARGGRIPCPNARPEPQLAHTTMTRAYDMRSPRGKADSGSNDTQDGT
jgi:hypothetical protein